MYVTSLRLNNIKAFIDTGELELSKSINLLVGANNSGKSTVLKSIYALQPGNQGPVFHYASKALVRHGTAEGKIWIKLTECDPTRLRVKEPGQEKPSPSWQPGFEILINSGPSVRVINGSATGKLAEPPFHRHEPNNFIYPYFSQKKVGLFSDESNPNAANSVQEHLTNLYAKVDKWRGSLSPEEMKRYNGILGFPLSTFHAGSGKRAGIIVDRRKDLNIAFDEMGEGITSLMGLVVMVHSAKGNLFLIEELENDLHPRMLKGLLDIVLEKSAENQFVISTHSNIVLKHLGSAPGTKIFLVKGDAAEGTPTSSIELVSNNTSERLKVLRELGYDFCDFDLSRGYLFLEESSAERIIREFLIPWFTPKLKRELNTLACDGVADIEPRFTSFHRLFLYAHREAIYKERAWVLADGDDDGQKIVREMREAFRSWKPEHFRNFTQPAFEKYYPARFQAEADEALALQDKRKRREAKKKLVENVAAWVAKDLQAKEEFAKSAEEVIGILKEIESHLNQC